MTVVAADGQDVEPVTVEEFRIATAETYDVIVEPSDDRAYTVFAQSIDRTGYARGTLAPRDGMTAEVPALDVPQWLTMMDMMGAMAMPGAGMHDHGAMNADVKPAVADKGTAGMDHSGHNMAGMDHSADAMSGQLAMIQNELFDLGADLCCPTAPDETHALRMLPEQVTRLEVEIDQMNLSLATLKSFVLPGGSPLSAYLHLARTIARRAERRAHTLALREQVNAAALNYLNRLSDWLFVASRMANLSCGGDVLWEPGATRQPRS